MRAYSESWTNADGGRWRSGVENAAEVLRAAGYVQVKPCVWQTTNEFLPRELTASVASAWPFRTTLRVTRQ